MHLIFNIIYVEIEHLSAFVRYIESFSGGKLYEPRE